MTSNLSARQGRPTNFTAPFKGNLSIAPSAVAARVRAANRTLAEVTIEKASNTDHQARASLKKKYRDKLATLCHRMGLGILYIYLAGALGSSTTPHTRYYPYPVILVAETLSFTALLLSLTY